MQITLMQMLYAATVVLLFGYVSTTVAINHGMMVLISIFAALLGLAVDCQVKLTHFFV